MQKIFLFATFFIFSLAYSAGEFKTIIVTNDGKEHLGFLFELDYYDLEHREPEDLYKIFLYDGERKRKSSFEKFDVSEIDQYISLIRKTIKSSSSL